MDGWPPRSVDGLHGATYEWDGPNTAVRCICGFYRITDTHERAEMEYMHHIPGQFDPEGGRQVRVIRDVAVTGLYVAVMWLMTVWAIHILEGFFGS